MNDLSKKIRDLLLEVDYILVECACEGIPTSKQSHCVPLSKRAINSIESTLLCKLRHPKYKAGCASGWIDPSKYKIISEKEL